ncbi:MAG: DUF861 domain-containing protein [Marmoricola sp.]|nr:DUF861 domain-containing protein [Marmoricola sp.]
MPRQGSVPHFKVSDAPLVEFDLGDGISGQHAILYKSEDGTRLAGSFKESGVIKEVLPFDEFIYVVQGSTRITVADEDPIELAEGHCCYLRKGLDVTFQHSDDFQDVVVLVSDDPIDI